MAYDTAVHTLAAAWNEAAIDLGLRVVAPYTLLPDDGGGPILLPAWVQDFGRAGGTLPYPGIPGRLFAIDRRVYDYTLAHGMYCSVLGVDSYGRYRRDAYVEMLSDWGYYGPADQRPSWLETLW